VDETGENLRRKGSFKEWGGNFPGRPFPSRGRGEEWGASSRETPVPLAPGPVTKFILTTL